MNKKGIPGSLLKCLLLAGLLTACNSDEVVEPTSAQHNMITDKSAKISPLLRLVKDGQQSLQYTKAGKFKGKVSKILNYTSIGGFMEFTYDDNNPNGDLWIGQKEFLPGGMLQYEWKNKVVNGVCVESYNITDGTSNKYRYNPQGYLVEIKTFNTQNGTHVGTWDHTYNFNVAANTYRLTNILYSQPGQGSIIEFNFTYTAIPNKFPLSVNNYGNLQELAIFGKSSDVLVDQITSHYFFANATINKKKYNYTTDGDGLVTSITTALSKDNAASYSTSTRILEYSTNWQGIP